MLNQKIFVEKKNLIKLKIIRDLDIRKCYKKILKWRYIFKILMFYSDKKYYILLL